MQPFAININRGEWEVTVFNEKIEDKRYETCKYTVFVLNEQEPQDAQLPMRRATCTCQKSQLTGIPCFHVLAVCNRLRSPVDHYIDPHYSTQKALDIYYGVFHSYGDEDDWPHVSGPKIVPDKNLVNRGRRKKVRATMVMDEMKGTSRETSRRRRRNRQRTTQESEPSQPPQPIPMEAILSGRRGTVTPPRRAQRRTNERVQAGRQ